MRAAQAIALSLSLLLLGCDSAGGGGGSPADAAGDGTGSGIRFEILEAGENAVNLDWDLVPGADRYEIWTLEVQQIDDIGHVLFFHLLTRYRRIGSSDPCIKQPQVIIDLCHAAHCRTGSSGNYFLFPFIRNAHVIFVGKPQLKIICF